jgi:DNA-binding MarR family transcriptional regulator
MARPKPYYSVATLEPNSSVGFLIKRCGVLMTQVADRRFETQEISLTQWIALMTLTRYEHASATRLGAEMGHDMGALTRLVDELEQRGLVRRERSKRDRRAVEIAITPAGRKVVEHSKRLIVELLNDLVAPFSTADVDTLITLLQRMMEHLQQTADADQAAASARARPRRKGAEGVLP